MLCPIWGTPAEEKPNDGWDGRLVDSPRAGGEYFIARTAIEIIENCDDATKARLTSALVKERRLGKQCPEITSTIVSETKLSRGMSIDERVDSVLRYLESKSEHLGEAIPHRVFFQVHDSVNVDEYELNYFKLLAHSECIGDRDLVFLLGYLEETELISYSVKNPPIELCTLTVKGYARLEALRHAPTLSSRAFVAMWFDDSMAEAWERGINPDYSWRV